MYSNTSKMTIRTKDNIQYLPNHKHLQKTDKHFFSKYQFMKVQYRYQLRWFKRILGFAITIFSVGKLYWNERHAIEISRVYQEVLGSQLLQNAESIMPQNEGKLIHVTGYLDIPMSLQQHPYGVSIRAVKLKRRVQMYQWTEENVSHENDFDERSYQYKKVWKDKIIPHSNFIEIGEHVNPTIFPVETQVYVNSDVFLGSFILAAELKDEFQYFTAFTSAERPECPDIKMHMGLYYHSADIWKPGIGDLRVQFSFAGPTETVVSVIAKQVGRELRPFFTSTGNPIVYIHQGKKSHLEILHSEHFPKVYEIWWTRAATWILIFFGSLLSVNVLVMFSRRNVLVRTLMEMTALEFGLFLSVWLWTSAVGVAWLPYKPVFGVLLLAFAACSFLYFTTHKSHQQRRQQLPLQ